VTHNPVTTILAGEAPAVAHVHFHCGCGTTRRLTILDTHVHPAARFAAALRRSHTAGRWPVHPVEHRDAEASGWGAPTPEQVA
jgi:hypothetical protein